MVSIFRGAKKIHRETKVSRLPDVDPQSARRAPTHPRRLTFFIINVLGGTAVLAGYWHGLSSNPDTGDALWGGVPEWLRPVYTASMLLAAAGYFPFTYLLAFRVDPGNARIAGRFSFDAFNILYFVIMAPAALWMPLTFMMIAQPNPSLWIVIRIVLGLVGGASVALIAALLTLQPRPAGPLFLAAIAGAVAFSVQTAVLDALVWPACFPAP